MSMRPEATIWLDVVIIHHAHRAEIGIATIGILREGEVETRLEPILRDGVIPFWISSALVGWVAKPTRVRFRNEQSRGGDVYERH